MAMKTLVRFACTLLLLMSLAACADDGFISSLGVSSYGGGYYPYGYGADDNSFGYGVPFVYPGYPMAFGPGFGGDDWGDDDDD